MSVSVNKRIFGLIAAAAVAGMVFIGCNNPGSSSGGDVTNREGEAWVTCENIWGDFGYDEEDGCFGAVLRADGKAFHVFEEDGKWYGYEEGTWRTSGNTLIIRDSDGYEESVTYRVSGNKLTITIQEGPFSMEITGTRTNIGTFEIIDWDDWDNDDWWSPKARAAKIPSFFFKTK